ncbi:hypothetical protein TREMEDRAFT_63293 [Tremella mesenterica DSM 1558]|uniref:uncharacterized protein n=1 Tax=Tremella mesenterica (strain ATCC 24925 / CBS 8224 / DSM 1558 / NBRC 9311 / NRRL Y-6157 / RJB 2259-6 / UBC 559-6) TaxID=578456 RepID=UPI0003F4A415|nr:uncharacterized protein TREMEDRAFT_63293 [Tremella mesenterica DSM 1558]EIW68828.1 hypothetical protein TREMEDRAFT_63293 [Tremella mesenterica DSM 1558]
MTKYDEMTRRKSKVERCTEGIPVFMSYAILLLTWFAFNVVVSAHETLLRRGEWWHFIFQFIIYNTLFTLTILSLYAASHRSPGHPDYSLTPPHLRQEMSEKSAQHSSSIFEPPRSAPITDPDDIPLRFLRNSQWVQTRGFKERPSPLPMKTSHSHISPALIHNTDGSNPSAFPLPMSPFVPLSPADAGQEDEDVTENDLSPRIGDGGLEMEPRGQGMKKKSDGRPRRYSASDVGRVMEEGTGLMAKSSTGGPRWCKKCDGWKPDRCHHCRFCDRCVLKNKPFVLFINYSTLLAAYAAIECIIATFRYFADPTVFIVDPLLISNVTCTTPDCVRRPTESEVDLSPVVSMLMAIMGVFCTLAVGSLAGYHWHLMSRNKTTLEDITHSFPTALLPALSFPPHSNHLDQFQNRVTTNMSGYQVPKWRSEHIMTQSERRRLRREAGKINVYDLGWRENIKSVFFRSDKKVTWWAVARAIWPFARVQPKDGGHSFAYDPLKLTRLRRLTAEIHLGQVEEDDFDEDDDDDDEDYHHRQTHDPHDDEDVIEGSDWGSVKERNEEEINLLSPKGGKVGWFEA